MALQGLCRACGRRLTAPCPRCATLVQSRTLIVEKLEGSYVWHDPTNHISMGTPGISSFSRTLARGPCIKYRDPDAGGCSSVADDIIDPFSRPGCAADDHGQSATLSGWIASRCTGGYDRSALAGDGHPGLDADRRRHPGNLRRARLDEPLAAAAAYLPAEPGWRAECAGMAGNRAAAGAARRAHTGSGLKQCRVQSRTCDRPGDWRPDRRGQRP